MGLQLEEFKKNIESLVSPLEVLPKSDIPIQEYLRDAVKRMDHYECVLSQDIAPTIGMSQKAYNVFCNDFESRSKAAGRYLLTPSLVTGIEDESSLVICHEVHPKAAICICSETSQSNWKMIMISRLGERQSFEGMIAQGVSLDFFRVGQEDNILLGFGTSDKEKREYRTAVLNTMQAFIEQAAYLEYTKAWHSVEQELR